ncbi:MAG: DUF805 domain-containing protein [Caulobacter sp.]|nr:DUF805 domain-containing protein [Caulobacter sp.]
MNVFVESVRNGFSGLARFSGRDSARRFWPYAGVVVALLFLAAGATMSITMNTMFSRMQTFAIEHPDQATVTQGPDGTSIEIQGNHPELTPDMTPFFTVMQAGSAAVVILLAAAVTRRLHDRGRHGWWGLPPAILLAAGMVLFPRVFQSTIEGGMTADNMKMLGLLVVNNLLYLGSLALLIILLAGAGQPESNRYGPPAP